MKKNLPYKIFDKIDLSIALVGTAALICITFYGVIMRYCFGSPLLWQEEAQLGLVVWVVFMGGSYAFRSNGHIAIDILVDALPKRWQKGLRVFVWIISVLILGFMAFQSKNMLMQYINTGKISTSLKIPYAYIYCAVPIGLAFMIVSITLDCIDELWAHKSAKGEEK